MISTVSVRFQSPKSGRSDSVFGSICVTSPCSPPTFGWSSAYQAAAITALILITNCTRSIASTPHNPDTEANTTQIAPQISTVSSRPHPSITFEILIAASVTVAMIAQLKKRPR